IPTENKSVRKIINSFYISLVSVVFPAFAFGRNDSRHSSSPDPPHQLKNTFRYKKNAHKQDFYFHKKSQNTGLIGYPQPHL
ncbi:hypothetical protein J4X13_22980, partial [Escherichia coli]